MSVESECVECQLPLEGQTLIPHLESYHVGSRHFESIRVSCGECELNLPLSNQSLQLLIRHCRSSGHKASDIQTHWDRFVEDEKDRIKRLIECGTRLEEVRVVVKNEPFSSSISEGKKRGSDQMQTGKLDQISYDSDQSSAELQQNFKRIAPNPVKMSLSPSEEVNGGVEGNLLRDEVSEQELLPPTFSNPSIRLVHSQSPSKIFSSPQISHNSPAHRNDLREGGQSGSALIHCSQCTFSVERINPRRRPMMIRHAIQHGQSLQPLRCSSCSFLASNPAFFAQHSKSKRKTFGCTGQYVNVQTPEMITKTREIVQELFGEVDWNREVPVGKTIASIHL